MNPEVFLQPESSRVMDPLTGSTVGDKSTPVFPLPASQVLPAHTVSTGRGGAWSGSETQSYLLHQQGDW